MIASRTVAIDGVAIPEALIALEAQNHPSLSASEAWEASARALALKGLLLGRAHELGLRPEPQLDGAGREETEDEALIRAVLDLEVEVEEPTRAECQRLYDANRQRFMSPLLYQASHIVVAPRDAGEAAIEEAQERARRAIASLSAGAVTFDELARTISDCPSAAEGGRLGLLRIGDLAPEVERSVLSLAPGTVGAEPVRSRFGWHVLRLEERAEACQLPFEQVEDKILMHLESRAWAAAAARYAAGLAERARLKGVSLSLAPNGEIGSGALALGDLLDDGQVAARAEVWLAAADPMLASRAAQAAQALGVSVQEFVRQSVGAFVADASDERWTQLLSAAQGDEDPALAAVRHILRSQLTPAPQTFTLIHRRGG